MTQDSDISTGRAAHVYIPPQYRKLVGHYGYTGPSQRPLIFVEDDADFIARAPDMEYLLAVVPPRDQWARAADMRLVQTIGAGIDPLYPLDGLRTKAVVANSAGVNAKAVAEVGLALCLFLHKGYGRLIGAQREHRWALNTPPATEGTTMAIIGCGRIGMELARMARPLGITVNGTWSRPAAEMNDVQMFPPEETARLMAEADMVVSLLPITDRNRNFIDADKLGGMKPDAVLVNLGRGGVVDEAALAAMLHAGELRSAALDVFETEPLPASSDLWDCPGLIVSPHMAGAQANQLQGALALFLDNIDALEAGQPVPTAVDLAKGY